MGPNRERRWRNREDIRAAPDYVSVAPRDMAPQELSSGPEEYSLPVEHMPWAPGESPRGPEPRAQVGIAHYKPMFQFYKADCFMFEVRACIVGSTTRSQSSGARRDRDSGEVHVAGC